MLLLLDGPARQKTFNVDTITPIEVKRDAEPLPERQVVTIQSDGKIYVYLADEGVVPNAATITADGFKHNKTIRTYEAGPLQKVYILSQAGTVEVRTAERS